jgi:hypothetical protein
MAMKTIKEICSFAMERARASISEAALTLEVDDATDVDLTLVQVMFTIAQCAIVLKLRYASLVTLPSGCCIY